MIAATHIGRYDDWFEVLPFVQSALPPSEAKEMASQAPEASDTRDF